MNNEHSHLRGLAHDIRCIMATQRLAAERFERDPRKEVRLFAERLIRSIERITQCCKSTLDRVDPAVNIPVLETAAPLAIVEEVVSGLALAPTAEIRILVRANTDKLITTDTTVIYRILFNLMTNALRAIAKNCGRQLEIDICESGFNLCIIVRDDGPGLDFETYYWFTRHKSSWPARRATGTGLPTVLHLADLIGAEIKLVCSSHLGTAFSVEVPFNHEQTMDTIRRPRPAASFGANNIPSSGDASQSNDESQRFKEGRAIQQPAGAADHCLRLHSLVSPA